MKDDAGHAETKIRKREENTNGIYTIILVAFSLKNTTFTAQ